MKQNSEFRLQLKQPREGFSSRQSPCSQVPEVCFPLHHTEHKENVYSRGQDRIKSTIFTASSGTFLSEPGFFLPRADMWWW